MTGQQRAFRDLTKKRIAVEKLYKDCPRFKEPSIQVKRAEARKISYTANRRKKAT